MTDDSCISLNFQLIINNILNNNKILFNINKQFVCHISKYFLYV